jgi:ketosteroid isomerase-like protein
MPVPDDSVQHESASQDAARDADLVTLQRLNAGYIRSVRLSDISWFEEHLAADFFNSNPDGTLIDRSAFLKQVAAPCPVCGFDVEDVRIRFFGDTAIAHGRTTYTKPDGTAAAGRYTDVYVQQGGRWLCVSAHVTRA